MFTVSILCLATAYIWYMKKELAGKNLGSRSGNGNGEGFYGKKNIREDGSYVTTKWFMILLIPIVPLGTYRVWKGKTSHRFLGGAGIGISQSTEIKMERLKMDWQQIILTYVVLMFIIAFIVSIIYFISNK